MTGLNAAFQSRGRTVTEQRKNILFCPIFAKYLHNNAAICVINGPDSGVIFALGDLTGTVLLLASGQRRSFSGC